MDDFATLDATAQAELVRSHEVTPAELVDAAITRVEKLNPELNAVIHPLFEKATAATHSLPAGPLRGVPFVLKDLDGESAGDPHHAGIKGVKEAGYVSARDTVMVERFRAAGLVLVGKTNTPELGLVPTTEPEAYGPTRNPWDTTRSTGGSSGGSAAAVASGMVAIGHAGDGGGSIRIPASECGLVGLKPSRGRVPMWPDDAEGWAGLVARLAVTRTVRDTAAVLDAIAGPCPGDIHTPPARTRPYVDELTRDPGRLRVGVLTTPPDATVVPDDECVAGAENAARLLESLGHTVEDASPRALDNPELVTTFLPAFTTWALADVEGWGRRIGRPLTADDLEPATWSLAEMGRSVTATQYLGSLAALHRYSAAVQQWWADGWDVLLTPTVAEPPPTLGQFASTAENPLQSVFRATAIVAFTMPFNITGQPAISLPLHWTPTSPTLPIGVQLVAAYGREDLLIRLASQLEQAHPWSDKRPPIHA